MVTQKSTPSNQGAQEKVRDWQPQDKVNEHDSSTNVM